MNCELLIPSRYCRLAAPRAYLKPDAQPYIDVLVEMILPNSSCDSRLCGVQTEYTALHMPPFLSSTAPNALCFLKPNVLLFVSQQVQTVT